MAGRATEGVEGRAGRKRRAEAGGGGGRKEKEKEKELEEEEEEEDGSDGSEAVSGELDMTKAASSEGEASEEGEEEEGGEEVGRREGLRVDFDFVGASEVYYEAVKVLLNGFLEDATWDAHGAAEAVVGQTEVGTLVNSGEEEGNAIAMGTVMDLSEAKAKEKGTEKGKVRVRYWRADVVAFLQAKVAGKEGRARVEAALASGRAGLLLLERLINAPVQLVPKLLELTLAEVTAAAKAGAGPRYDTFLVLSRAVRGVPDNAEGLVAERGVWSDGEGGVGGDDAGALVSKAEATKLEKQARKAQKKRARREAQQREEELLSFVRSEDVILEANAEWSETWAASIPEGSGTGGFGLLRRGEKPLRVLFCLSRAGLEAAAAQLAQAFPEE